MGEAAAAAGEGVVVEVLEHSGHVRDRNDITTYAPMTSYIRAGIGLPKLFEGKAEMVRGGKVLYRVEQASLRAYLVRHGDGSNTPRPASRSICHSANLATTVILLIQQLTNT